MLILVLVVVLLLVIIIISVFPRLWPLIASCTLSLDVGDAHLPQQTNLPLANADGLKSGWESTTSPVDTGGGGQLSS